MRRLRLFILMLAVLPMTSCILFIDREVYFEARDMIENVMEAAPVFVNDLLSMLSTRDLAATPRTLTDDRLATLYNAFKEFDLTRPDETSAQSIDESNMYVASYKNLNYLQEILAEAANPIDEHDTPISVTTPFPLQLGGDVTWSKSGTALYRWENDSGFRYTADWVGNFTDTTVEATLAMTEMGDKDPGDTRQITMARNIYIRQDLDGGDILLDIVYAVDYDWPDDPERGVYAPRVWLDGNSSTGEFVIAGGQYGKFVGYQRYTTYRGAGTNADGDYMIFVVGSVQWDGETGAPADDNPTNTAYFKIPGGATEADLEGLTAYDTLADLVTSVEDPAGYGSLLSDAPVFSYDDFAHGVDSFGENTLDLP